MQPRNTSLNLLLVSRLTSLTIAYPEPILVQLLQAIRVQNFSITTFCATMTVSDGRRNLGNTICRLLSKIFPRLTGLALDFASSPSPDNLHNMFLPLHVPLQKVKIHCWPARQVYENLPVTPGVLLPTELAELTEVSLGGFPNLISVLQTLPFWPKLELFYYSVLCPTDLLGYRTVCSNCRVPLESRHVLRKIISTQNYSEQPLPATPCNGNDPC